MFAWDTHSQNEGNIIGSKFMKHNHTHNQLCLLLCVIHNTRSFRNSSIKAFVYLPEVLIGLLDTIKRVSQMFLGKRSSRKMSQIVKCNICQLYIYNLRRSFHLSPFNFHKNRNSNQGCPHLCMPLQQWLFIYAMDGL